MDVPCHEKGSSTTFTVLVTGANSGLGFALCCRLIDEFLGPSPHTRPQSQTLHLLFSTRDTKKSENTLKRLETFFQKTLRHANLKSPGIGLFLRTRVKIEGVLVDLLKLATVKLLAEKLLRRGQKLDAVVWNAGVAGWRGLNWPKAIWDVCTDLVQAVTYPTYMFCDVGARAQRQRQVVVLLQEQEQELAAAAATTADDDDDDDDDDDEQPELGEVFVANVFGHYLLTHWLAPLMNRDTRIVWISSTGAVEEAFKMDDIQGLKSLAAYESSKRLTEILVLTSDLPATRPYTEKFFSTFQQQQQEEEEEEESRPVMLVTHPGVVATSISGLHWFLAMFMTASFYIARWLGSPWHPIDPYKGAVSMAFAVLAPELIEDENREGKGKWGSTTGVQGDERVARTEVQGWGYCGKPGVVPFGSVTTGHYRGQRETTRERREEFEEVGRQAWRKMEDMRVEWERRLGPVSQDQSVDV